MVEETKEIVTAKPKTIGEYTIIRTISKGLQAVIKLVENQEGKQFAMKVFEPKGKEMQEKVLKDTRTEFQIVKSLNLTSIPKYYEFQEEATWTKSDG